MRVEHVMSRRVWTCRADEPLWYAARTMWDHDVGALPVLGADEKVVGVVTDRDICLAAYFAGKPLTEIPVEHAMSRMVYSVAPDQSVEAAEQLMREKRVRRVPVLAGAKLVGVISLGDIARASAVDNGLAAREILATLAAILQTGSSNAAPAA